MKLPELESAIASTRTGAVLRGLGATAVSEQLEELAATLPEIFGTAESECFERVALRLGAEQGGAQFAEVLLLSTSRVHVIAPLAGRAEQALLASAPCGPSVGLILSRVHAQASALEDEVT
jgi:hypothetical protein